MTLTQEEKRFLQLIHNTPEAQLEEIFAKLGLLEEYKKIVNS